MYKKGQRIKVPVGDDIVTFVVWDVYEAETYITVCFAMEKINDIGLNDGLTMQCFSIRIDKERSLDNLIIDSNEARSKTLDVIYTHQTEELRKIDKMINEAIMRGEFRCSFEGTISATTKRELERCGYTVIVGSQYNQSYVIIKWYFIT